VTPEFGTEPVVVAVVANEVEAEIACGLLRTEGIRCFHRLTDIAAAGFPRAPLGPEASEKYSPLPAMPSVRGYFFLPGLELAGSALAGSELAAERRMIRDEQSGAPRRRRSDMRHAFRSIQTSLGIYSEGMTRVAETAQPRNPGACRRR
jgi:hypothetical protein